MNKKPKCECGHTATQHANVKYTNKKGESKTYKGCRIKECPCKEYKPNAGTPQEPPQTQ